MCGERQREGRERLCVCVLCMCLLVCMGACLCVRVSFEMYFHCVCPSLVNVATRCVGAYVGVWVVRVLECTFICSGYPSPSFAGPLLKNFAVHLKHSRLRKVTLDWCTMTFADVATLLAEGLSENRTLEQLHISSPSSPEVSL